MSKKAILDNAMQELDDIQFIDNTPEEAAHATMAVCLIVREAIGLLDQEWRMVVKGLQGELDSKIERQLRNME